MNASMLRAPFPYFGGKGRKEVVDAIWTAFDPSVPNYIEGHCGSAAVLLARPGGPGKIETINDAAGAIPNVWRAVKADPEGVAKWCDWPVSEIDMHARHIWLVKRFAEILPQLKSDPEFYDVKAAGWWLWGAASWIGGGWCGGIKRGQPRPNLNSGQGVHALGVTRLPSIGNDRGINGVAAPPALEWMQRLCERLRRVRIVCGDWRRVLSPSVLGKGKNVGGRLPCAVFLDPPYTHEIRDPDLYAEDDPKVAGECAEWAREHGDDPDLRICLAGYHGEHDMPSNWTAFRWKGARGYASEANTNRELETLWFSPHCLPLAGSAQRSLFGASA